MAPPLTDSAGLPPDDLFDTFLDAAREEISSVKRELTSETANQVRIACTTLAASLAKLQSSTDATTRKISSSVTDLESRLAGALSDLNAATSSQAKKFALDNSTLSERISGLENRFSTLQRGADASTLNQAISSSGSVDSSLLVGQLRAQITFTDDLNQRLTQLERRSHVSPEAVAELSKFASDTVERVQALEVRTQQSDSRVHDLEDAVYSLRASVNTLSSMADRVAAVDALGERVLAAQTGLESTMSKCNKDTIAARAAINTLRAHSEETRMLGDEAKRKVAKIADDVSAADVTLKKLIAHVHSETADLSEQIKDVQGGVDRSDDRVENLARSFEKLRDEFGKLAEAVKATAAAAATQARPEVVEEATEPHIPTPKVDVIVERPFATGQMQEGSEKVTVIELPEKIVYEQPIVTVIRRRNIEVVENTPAVGRPLPRLGGSPGKREGELLKSDLKRFDDLGPRLKEVEAAIGGIKVAIDHITKSVSTLAEVKADKSELQTLFEQFRMALGELNGRIGSLRKAIVGKADVNDLQLIQQDFTRHLASLGATAGATEPVKCLLCGKPKIGVVGAIEDPEIAQKIGTPVSTRVASVDQAGNSCFVYGERGELYYGRSPDGKSIYSKGLREGGDEERPKRGQNSVT
jgi:DNA repair exonuclease SbcCD ATPase subunit